MYKTNFYKTSEFSVISRSTEQKKTKSKTTKYYVRFTFEGKEVERVIKGCLDKKQADKLAPTVYASEYKKLVDGIKTPKAYRDSTVTMEDAINKVFLSEDAKYFKFNKVGIQQEKQYKSRCRKYLIPFFADMKINCLTIDTVDAFRTFLKNQELGKDHNERLSEKTMNEIEWLVRTVMKWIPDLYPRANNFRNPYSSPLVKSISFDRDRNATPAFELDEVRRIFAASWENYPSLCMALIAAYTGMRSNEDACLRKCKFFPRDDSCVIVVDENWTFSERKVKSPKTKNGERKVVIPRWLYEFVMPILDSVPDNCFPFHNTKGITVPMKGDRYNRALEQAVENAGFLSEYKEKGLQFYSFRSFYRSFTEPILGRESALIRYVMGHSRKDIDDHYFKFLDTHIPILLSATRDLLPEDIIESLYNQKCYLDFVASLASEKDNQDCGSELPK